MSEVPQTAIPSVIDRGARFEGVLAFDATARVEGRVVGRVFGAGLLEIAPGACVEGEVAARSIVVEGELSGQVSALERIVVTASGAIRGRIETAALEVSEGATIEGPVAMVSAKPDEPGPPAVAQGA